jgi:hypothetical protein
LATGGKYIVDDVQKAEDRIQETGDRRRKTGDRKQRAEVYPPPAGQKNRAATVRDRGLAHQANLGDRQTRRHDKDTRFGIQIFSDINLEKYIYRVRIVCYNRLNFSR